MTEPPPVNHEGETTLEERVLMIDDDAELCELTAEYLTSRGFTVDREGDGERGLQRALEGHHDLLVLDVMLPGLDGFEVLRRVRQSGGPMAQLPIVMLTAHGDEVDRIVGLELGADDYLPKPFNPRELLARIRAIFRRVAVPSVPQTPQTGEAGLEHLRIGAVDMVVDARTVHYAGRALDLTATEFDLLRTLMCAVGRVVKREELAKEVLDRRLLPFDRSLDIHISNLRRKMGSGAEYIKTVRGVGYIFTATNNTQA